MWKCKRVYRIFEEVDKEEEESTVSIDVAWALN